MKVRIELSNQEEKEIIIRCREIDEEVEQIKEMIEQQNNKIAVLFEKETYFIFRSEIYYLEYVENKVFVYMEQKVYQIQKTLEQLEEELQEYGFFRCSKSMIINLNYVEKLKSSLGSRILATFINGEEVIISRHYAKLLRIYLKQM